MPPRRLPEPPFTPPSQAELDLGYWFDCPGCKRRWAKRYQDDWTGLCVPCARKWRRDDMVSRRRGLGGIPVAKVNAPHPFKSRVLKREIDLNSAAARRELEHNEKFVTEVSSYIEQLIEANASAKTPSPPLRDVFPLLPRKGRRRTEPVAVNPDHGTEPTEDAKHAVDDIIEKRMDVIDVEVVEDD